MPYLKILLYLALAYLFFVVLLFFTQRNNIYFPSRGQLLPSEWSVPDMKVVQLHTIDGLVLEAWYKAAKPGKPTLIYFHGNAGHIGHRGSLARPYLDKGYGVLLVEYRGYGNNPGSPSEQGLYKDARAAFKFLEQQKVPATCRVLYSESIGSGVAVQMAREKGSAALVMISPPTSLVDVARFHYPYLPVKWLMFDRYNSLLKIKKLHMPVFIIHGEQDRIIPVKFGKQLFEAANQPKQAYYYPKYGHNDIYAADLAKKVEAFLKRYIKCK